MPSEKDIEIPLLESLIELGGQAPTKQIYPLVSQKFSALLDKEIKSLTPSGKNKWINRIQWTRKKLVEKEEMYSPLHGIWAITNKGRERINKFKEIKEGFKDLGASFTIREKKDTINNYLDKLYYLNTDEDIKLLIKKLIEISYTNIDLVINEAISRIENNYYNGSKWSTLAFSLLNSLKEYEASGQILKKLVEIDDENPAYLNNYGIFLLRINDEKCIEYFAKAFALDFKNRGFESSSELPAWNNVLFLERILKKGLKKRLD